MVKKESKDKENKEKNKAKDSGMNEMDLMDLPGIGAATATKLKESGFDTMMSIAVTTAGEIVDVAGVSEAVARKVIDAARYTCKMDFTDGLQVLEKRQNVSKLSIGSKNFDGLLGGGFETGVITECFGQYGTGKTQIASTLAVSLQKIDPEAEVVYIDTESTFRPERIIQIAKGFGLDHEKVLKNIKIARAFNSDHQMLLAQKIEELIKKGHKIRVVIVDSLTAHFRAEFIGRGSLAERQQKLNRHMHVLSKLAEMYNIAVYVTNQVMAKPDMFFGDPTEAIGGNIVAHNSAFRIYLRRGKKGSRVAKLVDSPSLPEQECVFYLTTEGIKDEL